MVVDICGMWDRGSLPTKSEVFQYFSDRYNFTGADPNTPAWAGLHSLVSIPQEKEQAETEGSALLPEPDSRKQGCPPGHQIC